MFRVERAHWQARIPRNPARIPWRRAGMLCALLAAWPGLASAQDASAQDASAEAVRQVIDRVFAGMHEADSAKVRSAFAEGARFALLPEEGATAVQYRPIDDWLDAIAGSEGRWEEKVYDVVIQVDGDMASAWTPYTFYLDGGIRHCGVDSIELLRTPDGWKITQLSDTQRTEGCREVPNE